MSHYNLNPSVGHKEIHHKRSKNYNTKTLKTTAKPAKNWDGFMHRGRKKTVSRVEGCKVDQGVN
uniref:Uncharacterized protein n=1 Tax=Arundo donax TaxID=35708 RepID=A0A0A9CJQ6_ARUDO